MSPPIRGAVIGMMVLLGWSIVGTVGFMYIEDWNFLNSLYMTVITISTVGFGEVNKLGDGGKAFAMFLIVGGWASSVHVLARLGQLLFEGGFF